MRRPPSIEALRRVAQARSQDRTSGVETPSGSARLLVVERAGLLGAIGTVPGTAVQSVVMVLSLRAYRAFGIPPYRECSAP